MEAAIKMLESSERVDWEYDEDADVLYLSAGEPGPAVGIDLGDGLIARYDEESNEVVGVTLIGLRARVLRELEQ